MSTAAEKFPSKVEPEEQLPITNYQLQGADGAPATESTENTKGLRDESSEGYTPPRTAAEIRAIMKTDHEHLSDAELIQFDNAVRIMCRSLLTSARDKRLAATA